MHTDLHVLMQRWSTQGEADWSSLSCRFLDMFNSLHRQQLENPGSKMRFGHICSPGSAPTAFVRDHGVHGWPKVGSIAVVNGLHRRDDGTLVLQYELTRRFQILNLVQEEPYPVRRVTL